MSLLDKQEVQDICGDPALHARKWTDLYANEHQNIRHYCARSTEEREVEEKRMSNHYCLLRVVCT